MTKAAPRLLVLANMKGGATKSTTTAQLALALVDLGHPTLLIDLDEQTGSSTRMFGLEPSGAALRTALLDEEGGTLDGSIMSTKWGVDVIGGGPILKGIEGELVAKFNSYASFKLKLLVDDLLERCADRWHYVLFDTRPSYGIMTSSAITTAEAVLTPVCDGGTLCGLKDLLRNVRASRLFNARIEILGVLPTKLDRTQVSKVAQELISEEPELHIFSGIRNDQVFRKSELAATPAQEIDPKAPGLKDFRKLAIQVIARFDQLSGQVEAAE